MSRTRRSAAGSPAPSEPAPSAAPASAAAPSGPRVPRRRRARWPWVILGLLFVLMLLVLGDYAWPKLPAQAQATFVGRNECIQCHAEQGKSFAGSNHDRAMEAATDLTVLGDFNNCQLVHHGVTSRMFRRGTDFCLETEGPHGQLETFVIKYTFGVKPLQQYLVEFPGGKLQSTHLAWDTEKKQWFLLDPENRRLPHDDVLHWTNRGMNWNHMCAECHSTGVAKNYDLPTKTFHTSFHEEDVSCEACHGPGSLHVDLANRTSLFWDRTHGYGLADLKSSNSRVQIETCAQCHARRAPVTPGAIAGRPLLDYYVPELLDSNVYHCDGQIRPEEEGYEYGSFLQSKMFRNHVRCTDCHDPHTAKTRFDDNRLCIRCHNAGQFDTPAHHHHPVDSKGARCVECHMPETTYMHVDPRRDHSIRIPRPDLSEKLGTPNACNRCHKKPTETNAWAALQIVNWYGQKAQQRPHFGATIAAGRAGQPAAERDLIRLSQPAPKDRDVGPLVRASAVALLAQHYRTPTAEQALVAALDDQEELVRWAAARGSDTHPAVLRKLPTKLTDPLRAVRAEAARALAAQPNLIPADLQPAFQAALAEFRSGLEGNLDQPGANVGLGILHTQLGETAQAEHSYRAALDHDPLFQIARVQLAILLQQQGNRAGAEQTLRVGIAKQPQLADTHYVLGLLLAEDPQRIAEAYAELKQAAELEPTLARFQYNAGVLAQQLQHWDDAEKFLRAAVTAEPGAVDSRHALALLLSTRQKWSELLTLAEGLVQQAPGEVAFQVLYGRAQLKLGQLDLAERTLRGAEPLAPQAPEVLSALAELFEARGNRAQAQAYAARAFRAAPNSAEIRDLYQRLHGAK